MYDLVNNYNFINSRIPCSSLRNRQGLANPILANPGLLWFLSCIKAILHCQLVSRCKYLTYDKIRVTLSWVLISLFLNSFFFKTQCSCQICVCKSVNTLHKYFQFTSICLHWNNNMIELLNMQYINLKFLCFKRNIWLQTRTLVSGMEMDTSYFHRQRQK